MMEQLVTLREIIKKYGFPVIVSIPIYNNKEFVIIGEHYTSCGYFLRSIDGKIILEPRFIDCYYRGRLYE